jgi:hypothetical protein
MPAYESRHLEEASQLAARETDSKYRERLAKALARSEKRGRRALAEEVVDRFAPEAIYQGGVWELLRSELEAK